MKHWLGLVVLLGVGGASVGCGPPSPNGPPTAGANDSGHRDGGLPEDDSTGSDAGGTGPDPDGGTDGGVLTDGGTCPSLPPVVPSGPPCATPRPGPRFDVTTFGAAGDGNTNDRKAINTAIKEAMEAGGGTVFFPAGVCDAPRTYRVKIPSTGGAGILIFKPDLTAVHLTLEFAPNVTVEVIPNGFAAYSLLRIRGAKDVQVVGGTFVGDKHTHAYDTSGALGTQDHGHGVDIDRSTHVTLDGITARSFPGDGIYVNTHPEERPGTGKEDLRICRTSVLDNSRTGVAIITVNGLELRNNDISGTQKLDIPALRNDWQSGIDIEPNAGPVLQVAKNIDLYENTFRNNAGAGIKIWSQYGTVKNVSVRKNTLEGNGFGYIQESGYWRYDGQLDFMNLPNLGDFAGAGLEDILVEENRLRRMQSPSDYGVSIHGMTQGVVRRNDLRKSGDVGPYSAGGGAQIQACENEGTPHPAC